MLIDPLIGGVLYSPVGEVSIPDKPGLGASISVDVLSGLVGVRVG